MLWFLYSPFSFKVLVILLCCHFLFLNMTTKLLLIFISVLVILVYQLKRKFLPLQLAEIKYDFKLIYIICIILYYI